MCAVRRGSGLRAGQKLLPRLNVLLYEQIGLGAFASGLFHKRKLLVHLGLCERGTLLQGLFRFL